MSKRILVFILVVFISSFKLVYSQAPLRVEIPAKYDADFNLVPVGKDGIVLFNATDEVVKGLTSWDFTRYNTDFKEEETKKIAVPRTLSFDRYYYDSKENMIYVLFTSSSNIRGVSKNKGDLAIVRYNVSDRSIKIFNGEIDEVYTITGFGVNNEIAYIGGYNLLSNGKTCLKQMMCYCGLGIPMFLGVMDYKRHPILYTIDTKNNSSKLLPFEIGGSSRVTNIDNNTNSNLTDVLISNKLDRKNYFSIINEYENLNLKNTIKISTNNEYEIPNGKICTLNKDEKIILGTYSVRKNKSIFSTNKFTDDNNSAGVYFAKIENNQQKFIKFHSFTKFKTFFDFLSDRTKQKTQKKIEKSKAKGIELSYSYKLLVHDIINKGDEYIMVAEAYYPQYHTDCYWTYDSYGHPTQQCYSVFDGWRYTHAIVAGFDKQGELLWDNCFEIQDILSPYLKERVKVMLDGDNITLVYSFGGNINSKTINGNTVVSDKETTKVQTNYANDEVKENFRSDMDFWYDNYFIAYGFEKIKNDNLKGKDRKRTVFYFNKISFE